MMMPHRPSGFLWLLTLVVVAFGAWAAFFEINQAVRAPGQVIASARTQVLQAADGGVVTELLVKEGQTVQQGQVLAVLEKDRSLAAVDESRAKIAAQQAALARLAAEAEQQRPQFSPQLQRQWPEFVRAQTQLFFQRQQALAAELLSHDQALVLARDELALHRRLFASGDVARVEVMRAERQVIDLEGRRRSAFDKYITDARTEMARLEEDGAAHRYKLDERKSVLRHTEITAPMAGVVKHIRFTTSGAVLRAGDELMQISPVDDQPLLEVKVNPADVGQLRVGLPARMRLDAFDSSIHGTLAGQLIYLSPDTLSEQGPNGQAQVYYRAQVRVDWSQPGLGRIEPADLKAGMTASIDILTGTRSVLTYLFKPIHRAFAGALSEK